MVRGYQQGYDGSVDVCGVYSQKLQGKTWVLATSVPPQGEGSDYGCIMGRARGGLWEPVYGGHTKLRISKDVKHNLVHNIKTKEIRGSFFSGTLREERKEGKAKRVHRSIAPSKVTIVFYRRTVRVHQIETYKEGAGCQKVGKSIRPT